MLFRSVAQNILTNFDSNSLEAKGIIEAAKAELAKAAENAVSEMATEAGATEAVESVKGALGSFGQ